MSVLQMKMKESGKDGAGNSLPDFATAGPHCIRYAEAVQKGRELRARCNELQADADAIRERNPRGFGIAAEIVNPPVPKAPPREETELYRLLGDLLPAAPPPPELVGRDGDLVRAKEISRERESLDAAIRVLDDQLIILRRNASREYCELIANKYRPVASRMAAALLELGRAMEEHDAFTGVLGKAEVQWSFLVPVERPQWFGLMRQLRSAVEGGHLDPKAIPTEWRNYE